MNLTVNLKSVAEVGLSILPISGPMKYYIIKNRDAPSVPNNLAIRFDLNHLGQADVESEDSAPAAALGNPVLANLFNGRDILHFDYHVLSHLPMEGDKER